MRVAGHGEKPDNELATKFIGERLRNHDSVILIAETGLGSIVGFCQLYPSFCSLLAAPIYALYDLYVRPETRRSGAGRALLQAARQQAIERLSVPPVGFDTLSGAEQRTLRDLLRKVTADLPPLR